MSQLYIHLQATSKNRDGTKIYRTAPVETPIPMDFSINYPRAVCGKIIQDSSLIRKLRRSLVDCPECLRIDDQLKYQKRIKNGQKEN